jgi:hypothetical protein
MAQTNVQAFSGDVEISSNLAVDTNTLFVDSVNNKVGIGVTEPGATLEVTGNAYVSSNLEVGTAKLFVDTVNSRVGIGTVTPLTKMHLVGQGTGSGPRLRFETLNNGNDNYTVSGTEIGGIQFGADDFAWVTQHISSEIVGMHFNPGYTGAQGVLAFKTSTNAGSTPTEKMRISSGGMVGIGTNSPSTNSRLTIYKAFAVPSHGSQTGTDSASSILWKTNLSTGGGNPSPVYYNVVQDGASIFFQPRSYQYVGSPHAGHHGALHMSAGYSPQSFPNSASNFALSSANGLGIGTADPNSYSLDCFQRSYRARNNNAAWAFGVGNSEFFIYGGSNGTHGVYMPYNATSWSPNSSDSRTKKNFTPIENSLEKLRNIRPILFHYLEEEDTDEKRLGFIAQDWLAQQPECVYHNESTGNLTMSLTETIPVLCAGIKELDSNQQVIQEVVNNLSDFTGQHRCLMKDISPNDYPKYEGLVVSANNNEYLNHDSITKPTINEALPIVSLTNKEKDKTCLGVISLKADPESYLPDDPTRLKINALGEGGIWTININGSLESGDYITSSNIAGYGMRQDDDIIHNYTIAKITQDCDFTKKMRKIKTLVKELKDITYYKFTYKVNITKDEYDVTDESLRLAEDYEYYSREQIRFVNDDTPGLYDSDGYQRIDDIQTVSKEEYDQNQSLYDKETKYKIKDSDEIAKIDEEIYNLDPSKYDVEVIYTTKSMHLSKEEYDKNPSLYDVIKIKIKECKCDKDKFDEMKDEDGMKHEFKLVTSTKYYKLDKRETTEPQPGYETEVRRELVNVLDENGQLTWTESEETETEYDLRYLTSDGNITDEANTVHIAAFVGCTYHCG